MYFAVKSGSIQSAALLIKYGAEYNDLSYSQIALSYRHLLLTTGLELLEEGRFNKDTFFAVMSRLKIGDYTENKTLFINCDLNLKRLFGEEISDDTVAAYEVFKQAVLQKKDIDIEIKFKE